MRTEHLSTRLFLLIGGIAMVPLLILGGFAVQQSNRATETTAKEGIREIAKQAAARVDERIGSHVQLVEGLAQTLRRPFLDRQVRRSVLDAYALRFPEFKHVAIVDRDGTILLGTDPSRREVQSEARSLLASVSGEQIIISDLTHEDGYLPTIHMLRRLGTEEILLAEINLARLWQILDTITVGQTGRVFLLDRGGRLIADSALEGKRLVLEQAEIGGRRDDLPKMQTVSVYNNIFGKAVVGFAQEVPSLNWTVIVEQDQAEAFAAGRFSLWLLAIIVLLLVGFVLALGTRGSRVVTKPLEDLVAATKAISKGNLFTQVEARGHDERAELARAFNNMVRELGRLHEQIAQRERMSVLGRIASELIHDLRHPIRNLENAAQLVNQRGEEKQVREMFTRVTEREFDGVNRFLRNLEQLIGEPTLSFTDVDISEEIEALVCDFRNRPDSGKYQFVVHHPAELLRFRSDRFALQRILRNLLQNAIESMPEGGIVCIEIVHSKGLEIHVQDNGPGIPEDKLATLFDAFRTTKRRGLGLGLAIAKKLTIHLGGEISAANQPAGGAAFALRFPPPSGEGRSQG